MKPARRRIEVNLEELDRVLDGARQTPLSETDYDKLKGALHALAALLVPSRPTGLLRGARGHQQCRQGMQGALEFVVIGLAQGRLPGSVQHPVQFLQIHLDTAPGGFHPVSPSSSRNPFVNGYPRTCLI